MNNGGHMHGMAIGPPSNGTGGGKVTMNHRHMMMHETFFWGKNTEILFSSWSGYNNLGMYILGLVFVFFMTIFIEFLSHSNYMRVGLLQTTLYGLRIG
ncbi:hypothetical protein H5410_029936 [Solanum commersonii]|uniref:Copper transporter n=1 Tax=Solanum commersonii TaxID=4109 RepID=A0A9J5YHU3_SOLCO|nr:hypothetical protein H5410_029936 [Solanum commersonii]